ncbi:MAG: DUF362 domain-containing protein [Candidatus Eisenbacteria bacterium]|nr:DUF362 domain-containing protein [Candidatus Eisenbacteria bacterium]
MSARQHPGERKHSCPRREHRAPCARHGALGRDRRAPRAQRVRSPLNRRRFLQRGAAGLAGLAAAPHILGGGMARAGCRNSRVVRTFHDEATSGMSQVHQWPVDLMVHRAIRELTGVPETAAAWKSLFPGIDATKRVAIKINLACGDVPTHPEVVHAIVDGLLMMDLDGQQLPPEQIIVWDHDTAFFCPQTGYTVNYGGPGVQYYGTDYPGVGFDYDHVFTIEHPYNTSNHSPSSIITQRCDYLINAAVIKDHSDSEITLCLKNHYGSFSNIAIYETHMHPYHGDGHARTQPELSRILRDELGAKTKLWLIDGTLGLYDGGPGYTVPWHTPPNWAYNSFLAAQEIVALDRIGTMKINEERARHGLGALDPTTVTAAAGPPFNLGTDDPAEIDLIEVDLSAQSAPHGAVGPRTLALLPPYPNPARGAVTLRLHCSAATDAQLAVLDARGAVVRRIRAGRFAAGLHRLPWDGRDSAGRRLPSGAYFAMLQGADVETRERIVLIR